MFRKIFCVSGLRFLSKLWAFSRILKGALFIQWHHFSLFFAQCIFESDKQISYKLLFFWKQFTFYLIVSVHVRVSRAGTLRRRAKLRCKRLVLFLVTVCSNLPGSSLSSSLIKYSHYSKLLKCKIFICIMMWLTYNTLFIRTRTVNTVFLYSNASNLDSVPFCKTSSTMITYQFMRTCVLHYSSMVFLSS